jgi:hypothetical protein
MIIAKTVPSDVAMSKAIRARVATDDVFAARVDDAVLRVLMSKQAAGLLPCV